VARAEADPREKVRPALQLALIRAIREFLAANAPRAVAALRRRRSQRRPR
jgi:hypothetical protein